MLRLHVLVGYFIHRIMHVVQLVERKKSPFDYRGMHLPNVGLGNYYKHKIMLPFSSDAILR